MAAIDTYLAQILNAVYGRDVRQAIHDGIQECYHDNTGEVVDVEENSAFKGSNILRIKNVDNGHYWNNSTGAKGSADTYSCSYNLIKIDPNEMVNAMLVSENPNNMYVTCFDANKQLINYLRIYGKIERASSAARPSSVIPAGTEYIGLSVQNEGTADEIVVRKLENVNVVKYPYDDPNIIYIKNCWRNPSGVYQAVDNYDFAVIAGIKAGEKYYTNARGQVVLNFFSATSDAPLESTVEDVDNNARIFTAPAGTAYAVINIAHGQYHGSASQYATVVHKMTKGKSVLAIGDSITWLDGRSGEQYDGATSFLGWQKQISEAGYKIIDYGFSGYTYAKDVMDGSTQIGSIYNKVVTDEYDVSGYDYIVLAGGTNDDLYAVTVGTVPNEYQHTYTDAELKTTVGALGAIIDYIRAHNPTCKIILCTQNKSQSTQRPYSEAVQYADGIKGMAKYASCYLCDLF